MINPVVILQAAVVKCLRRCWTVNGDVFIVIDDDGVCYYNSDASVGQD